MQEPLHRHGFGRIDGGDFTYMKEMQNTWLKREDPILLRRSDRVGREAGRRLAVTVGRTAESADRLAVDNPEPERRRLAVDRRGLTVMRTGTRWAQCIAPLREALTVGVFAEERPALLRRPHGSS